MPTQKSPRASKGKPRPNIETPFTQRLRAVMAERGIRSTYELADMAGLRESTVRQILRGTNGRLSSIEAIARACDVSLDWLAFGKGKRRISTLK